MGLFERLRGCSGRRRHLLVGSVVAVATAVLAASAAGAAHTPSASGKRALTQVSIRLDWFANGSHAGFYAAKALGYYEKAGLDVDIQEGQGSASTVQLVGTGRNTFGYVAPVAMIPAVQQGANVVMVADVIQKDPAGILVRADSGITKPSDLVGKSCGISPFGFIHKLVPAFAAKTKINADSLKQISVSPDALVPGMAQKRFDAMCDTLFEDIYLRGLNVPTKVFRFADYGINVLAHGIVVNKSTIDSQPDVVKKFVAASMKGFQYAFDNPNKSVGLIQQQVANQTATPVANVAILKSVKNSAHTANSKGKPLGWMSRKDWVETEALMFQYLDLSRTNAPGVDQLFTNKFIPAASAKKKAK
jgi:NitT/TauT family transport system substrate-binding protein